MIRAILNDLKDAALGIVLMGLAAAALLALIVGGIVLQVFMFEYFAVEDYRNTVWVCEQPALTVSVGEDGLVSGTAQANGKQLQLVFSQVGSSAQYCVLAANEAGSYEEVAAAELSIDEKQRQMHLEIEHEEVVYTLQLNCVSELTPLGKPLTPFGKKVVLCGSIFAALMSLVLGIKIAARVKKQT